MLTSLDDLLSTVSDVYQSGETPKAFGVLRAALAVRSGANPKDLARALRTTAKKLREAADAPDPVVAVFGASLAQAASPASLAKARKGLGQMLLGTLSERIFESIYKEMMGTEELELVDTREGRSDTDYRVLNGSKRQVFRINIKFFGSPFRNAPDLVGLQSDDCFALATYKISQAVQKQEKEALPYIFAIVGVPGLRGESVGEAIPGSLAHLVSLVLESKVPRKRDVEDAVVLHLVDNPQSEPVESVVKGFEAQIRSAPWKVISARKADLLLRRMLFERVYAVRVRAFAKNYRGAEVDMHFSTSQDLTPLEDFLRILREKGLHGLTALLERGDV